MQVSILVAGHIIFCTKSKIFELFHGQKRPFDDIWYADDLSNITSCTPGKQLKIVNIIDAAIRVFKCLHLFQL